MRSFDTDEPLEDDDKFGSGREPQKGITNTTPFEYLRNHGGASLTLYYPGARVDMGPFHLFTDAMPTKRVIYADYGMGELSTHNMVQGIENWEVVEVEPVEPDDFRAQYWEDFWPEDPGGLEFGDPATAFGIRARLLQGAAREIEFIYLGAEGIQTLGVLIKAGTPPSAIVLQDHGVGGNWSRFGGSSPLYDRAVELDALPRFLLVAENTKSWPGYRQVSDLVPMAGQQHDHSRALFERESNIA